MPDAIVFSATFPLCGDVEMAIHHWNTVSMLNARQQDVKNDTNNEFKP